MIGGRGEIRTHGGFLPDGFQDRCLKPLSHSPFVLALELGIEPRTNRVTTDCSTAELLQNLGCGRENRTPSHLAYETSVTPCEPAKENEYYLIKYKVYRYAWRGWQDSNLRTHYIGSDQPVPLCQLSYIHKEDDCFHPDGSYRE